MQTAQFNFLCLSPEYYEYIHTLGTAIFFLFLQAIFMGGFSEADETSVLSVSPVYQAKSDFCRRRRNINTDIAL